MASLLYKLCCMSGQTEVAFKGKWMVTKNMGNKSATPESLLGIANSLLPLHAEEGRRRDSIPEKMLIDALIAEGAQEETATTLVYVLRRQFEAMALLDPMDLQGGNWAFVSFPASLLGRSWIATLSTPRQALLPLDYWEQGDTRPSDIKEEQRSLLRRIETGRVKFNSKAQPIRVVHVAWALIRLGEKFLLHHREDKDRPGEKSYVLPGGRFNLSDLPVEIQARQDILKEISSTDSKIAAQHINATLERELEEEAGLQLGMHYTYEPFGMPIPLYKAVNGAGNRYAYTAYKFNLYKIKLTQTGETHLLACVSRSSNLTWFSAAEIVAPQRSDGASAYVDALHYAWGDSMERYLSETPDSCFTPPVFAGESKMLDLPASPTVKFQIGKSGKEKPASPTTSLIAEEWQLLMLLGWHARGFQIKELADSNVRLLGNGWVEAPTIITIAQGLYGKLNPVLPGLLEIRENRYISLRISPDILFFTPDGFLYQILGNTSAGGKVRIKRNDQATIWGWLEGDEYIKDISGRTVATLRELEKGDEPEGDWGKNLREQLGEGLKAIGIRRIWSEKGNIPCLVDGLRKFSDERPSR